MQDDKVLKDPNYFARKKSEEMWARYMFQSKNIARWILTCNFFFGVLPGILFFVSNVRISQEDDESTTQVLPDFNRAVNWFGILFVLFPMFISLFQMIHFYRLISLRMTRTFFVGQLIGFVFYMCAFSKNLLQQFHWFPKKTSFIGLVIILVVLVMVVVFLPYLFLFSEVVSYKIHDPHRKQEPLSSSVVACLLQKHKKHLL